MKILVTGAAGMIGQKLCARLARDSALGERPISSLHMVDVAAPALAAAAFPVTVEAADIADPRLAPRLMASRPDIVVHRSAFDGASSIS